MPLLPCLRSAAALLALIPWAHVPAPSASSGFAPGGVRFHVLLLHGAPNWDYYVELSQDGACKQPAKFQGFTTDASGFGVFEGELIAAPGSYTFLVDVVSDPSNNVPANPKLREIAQAQLLDVTLP